MKKIKSKLVQAFHRAGIKSGVSTISSKHQCSNHWTSETW